MRALRRASLSNPGERNFSLGEAVWEKREADRDWLRIKAGDRELSAALNDRGRGRIGNIFRNMLKPKPRVMEEILSRARNVAALVPPEHTA
jgi:hypothetical protein